MTEARQGITRREVIALGAALAGGVAVPGMAAGARTESSTDLLTRPIGRHKERLSVVGLGTNNYSPKTPEERATRRAVIARLPALGASVIDTAPAYGQSESVLGELIADTGVLDRLFVATKVTAPSGSLEQAKAMIEESFRRLRTQKIDLLQVHNLDGTDVVMPTLVELRKSGRVRYIGVTTSRPDQYPAMLEAMRRHPVDFIQIDYSIDNRDAAERILPLARERGIAVLINMPFGGRREGNLIRLVGDRALPPWAGEIGAASWGQFFLKYVLANPAVTCAIPGMTKVSHLEDNMQAARGALPDEKMRQRMERYWDSELKPALASASA